jgi:NAD-dependent dihydropyrimidine dehydrogenase PreA subunit
MKRDIIKIDEDICNGCGDCIPNCHEGALQIIDGKARLVSDLMCDGLGACIGHCPLDAISIETREAEPYDEIKVIQEVIPKGYNTILAHLKHLKDHNETAFVEQGLGYLETNNNDIDMEKLKSDLNANDKQEEIKIDASSLMGSGCGCEGSAPQEFNKEETNATSGSLQSQLTHWPVQLHLINPASNFFQNADLLIAADCVAYTMGNFHQDYLKDKALIIACPKLDSGLDTYIEKITALINDAKINTITLLIMEVPCCGGMRSIVEEAISKATRKVPVKLSVVGIKGDILSEEWI